MNKIVKYIPTGVRIVTQGEYVAKSLAAYLGRHPNMAAACSTGSTLHCLTTESPEKFHESATLFMHEEAEVEKIVIE